MNDPFSDWTEIDVALHQLGLALGLLPASWQEARGTVETSNPTSRGLLEALLALVSAGVVEANFVVEPDGAWRLLDDSARDYAFRRTTDERAKG